MAEVKTIRQYRTKQDGNTLIELPVVDEESKNIIEVNFNQYMPCVWNHAGNKR
ncbi:MAG: hypothetical protein J6K48_04805 [Lachnospiraceae bacterium]|nr:hypothetical protein [Lachnospiraceae bacterium]